MMNDAATACSVLMPLATAATPVTMEMGTTPSSTGMMALAPRRNSLRPSAGCPSERTSSLTKSFNMPSLFNPPALAETNTTHKSFFAGLSMEMASLEPFRKGDFPIPR